MSSFWPCFVLLFVAVDVLGVLPIFLGLTAGMGARRLRMIILQSVVTATFVALAFAAFGRLILNLMGITVADFMIAGGSLLFVLALNDLITVQHKKRLADSDNPGVVPLAVPLIVGPAVLTTILLLLDQHGVIPTLTAAVANILLAGLILLASGAIVRVIGNVGAKALSKIASLLLAAVAVMMIRKGLVEIIVHH